MPKQKRDAALANNLVETVKHRQVLQLYLAATPLHEIAEKAELTLSTVKKILDEVQSNLNYDMASLAERIFLLNLARTQELVHVTMPAALEGDLKSMRILLDIIKLQQSLAEGVKPKEDNRNQVSIHIENFEQTFTSSNPLYAIAQENMEDEWLNVAERSIDEIYRTPVLEAPPQLDDDILTVAERIEKELINAEPESPDGLDSDS